MMPNIVLKKPNQTPGPVSIDEFMEDRKDFAAGDMILKGWRSPPSWNATKRTADFIMSAETEDRDRDIIVQAGLDIEEFLKNPVALYGHNSWGFPIGKWQDLTKNDTGRPKRLEGTIALMPEGKDEVADRVAAHLEAGTLKCASIGFIARKVERREKPEGAGEYYWPGYKILEAELVECSVVVVPSNRAAMVKDTAAGKAVMSREAIEEVLDTWTRTPAGLLVRREVAEAAYARLFGDQKGYYIGLDKEEPKTVSVTVRANDVATKTTPEEIAGEAIEAELGKVEDWWKDQTKPEPVVQQGIVGKLFGLLKTAVGVKPKAAPEPEKPAPGPSPEKIAADWAVAKREAEAVLT